MQGNYVGWKEAAYTYGVAAVTMRVTQAGTENTSCGEKEETVLKIKLECEKQNVWALGMGTKIVGDGSSISRYIIMNSNYEEAIQNAYWG